MKYPELSHHYKMHRRDAPAPVSLTAVIYEVGSFNK